MEDRINYSVHALHIDKAHHGPSLSSHFYETAFDDIGGAKFPPQVPGEAEEREQFWQIIFQDGWRSLRCFLIFVLLAIPKKWVPHPFAVFKRVR